MVFSSLESKYQKVGILHHFSQRQGLKGQLNKGWP